MPGPRLIPCPFLPGACDCPSAAASACCCWRVWPRGREAAAGSGASRYSGLEEGSHDTTRYARKGTGQEGYGTPGFRNSSWVIFTRHGAFRCAPPSATRPACRDAQKYTSLLLPPPRLTSCPAPPACSPAPGRTTAGRTQGAGRRPRRRPQTRLRPRPHHTRQPQPRPARPATPLLAPPAAECGPTGPCPQARAPGAVVEQRQLPYQTVVTVNGVFCPCAHCGKILQPATNPMSQACHDADLQRVCLFSCRNWFGTWRSATMDGG